MGGHDVLVPPDQFRAIRVVAVEVGVNTIQDRQGQSAPQRDDRRNLPAVQRVLGESAASLVVVNLPNHCQVEYLPYVRVGAPLFGRKVVIVLRRDRCVLNTLASERLAPYVVGSQAEPVRERLGRGNLQRVEPRFRDGLQVLYLPQRRNRAPRQNVCSAVCRGGARHWIVSVHQEGEVISKRPHISHRQGKAVSQQALNRKI